MSRRFARASRARLTNHDLDRFPGDTLFERAARAVCGAGCLPRKELFEAWEVARRVRRLFRGGRIVDLGGGHGMLAHFMLLLDDSSPDAVVVDRAIAPSAAKVHDAVAREWPRVGSRVAFIDGDLGSFPLQATDVVVSSHACGALTDRVLQRAMTQRARVAVLPCCHDLAASDDGGLSGWLDGALAIDVVRATRLRAAGYRVRTQIVPADVTPKNRLLIAAPRA